MKILITLLLLLCQQLYAQENVIHYRSLDEDTKEGRTQMGNNLIQISYPYHETEERKIWGNIVPYNEVWTGVNGKPARFSISQDIVLYGSRLRAGTYALLFQPARPLKRWKIIFCRNLERFDNPKDYALVLLSHAKRTNSHSHKLYYLLNLPSLPKQEASVKLVWGKASIEFVFTNAR